MRKENLTHEEYLAYPAVSTSDIKQILENPYKYKIGGRKEETPAMKLGSLTHKMVLEPNEFLDKYAVAPDVDKRTKEGKERWGNFTKENEGKIIVDYASYGVAEGILLSLKANGVFDEYFTQGEAESSYIGKVFDVDFKVRPDYFIKEKDLIVDLKCVNNASPKSFQTTCANLKYYIQAYLYMKVTGAKNFIFVAVETKAPYTIGIYELDYIALEQAEQEVKKALDILGKINDVKNVFNGLKNKLEPTMLTLPAYVFYGENN